MTDNKKPSCFVIQEFDEDGKFDRRYGESVHPALIAAGVEPKRADRILGLQPIIQKIEDAINDADICVAEVSTDNPNVWLELGYALALDRPVVILCDRDLRERLPFDIQHRPVILYRADSKSGFDELEKRITQEVKNQLSTASRVTRNPILSRGTQDINNLKSYEVAVLASLLAMWPSSPEGATASELEKHLKRLGHDEVALGFGITRLLEKAYIQQATQYGSYDNEWTVFKLTPEGMAWLHANEDQIEKPSPNKTPDLPDFDDEIPF